MTKKDKIILYSSSLGLVIAFLIYNNTKKNILYSEILKRIGGGTIKFDELPVWTNSFLNKIKATGKAYAIYKQDTIKQKAEQMYEALDGLGEDEDAIYTIFEYFNSKVGVNQLVTFYNAKYIKDGYSLKKRLQDLLSSSELSKVSVIISRKPNVIYI